jgi:hypothetical protein
MTTPTPSAAPPLSRQVARLLLLLTIVYGIVRNVYYAAFLLPIAASVSRAAAAGNALYLVYVASIGGDFMSGRFFAVPLLCAVLILTRLAAPPRETWLVGAIAVVVLGAASARMPILSDSRFLDTGVSRARFDEQVSVKIKPTD